MLIPWVVMYTSPCSVCSSHRATVARKLEIITCTPMVTATAIISAAAATTVRLCERMTLRGAMRPSRPNKRPNGAPSKRIKLTVTMGVRAARPMITRKVPPKLITSERVGMRKINVPANAESSPSPAARLTARLALFSNPARESARRGATAAASQAGGAAASRLAIRPASAPLSRLAVGICTPRTLTTKNRSLIV